MLSLMDFGAAGDGIADDTAAAQAFFAAGGGYIPAGVYLIDDILITNPVDVRSHAAAVFKRRSAPAAASDLICFAPGSEGSIWDGGTVDGDRAAKQPLYDTTGRPLWTEFRIMASDISVPRLSIVNALHNGLYVNRGILETEALDNIYLGRIDTRACTANTIVNVSDLELGSFRSIAPDNDGMPIDVRGLSINTIYGGWIGNIQVSDMTGDAAVPSPTCAVTGVLGIDLYDVSVGGIEVAHSYGSDIFALCVSIPNAERCVFDRIEAKDYCGVGIELINFDSHLRSFFVDGKYRSPGGAYTALTSVGLTAHASWVYPLGNRSRRINRARATQPLIENGLVRRVGIGIDSGAPGVRFRNVHATACMVQGIKHYASDTSIMPTDVSFEDCAATFCQSSGFSLRAGAVRIAGGNYANNGQDATIGSNLRVGIGYAGSVAVPKITMPYPPIIEDTQSLTVGNAVSFKPGNAAQTFEPNPDYFVYTFTQLCRDRFSLGQNVLLKNVTGSDRVGTIIDIDHDELTVRLTGAMFLTSTGNTTNVAGTWSGAGTTLTGVGTTAMASLKEGQYVGDGSGAWKQVVDIIDDTTIIVENAFASPLVGAVLTEISIDVAEIPSQQYGVYFNSASIAAIEAVGWIGSGNQVARTLFHAGITKIGAALF
jgi:hypothetical protein